MLATVIFHKSAPQFSMVVINYLFQLKMVLLKGKKGARPMAFPKSMHPLLNKLIGGDLRSIGRSNEVVSDVLNDLSLVEILVSGIDVADPIVRMRSADALEKISAKSAEHISQYKAQLLQLAARASQKEVQWHLALMLPRLPLTRNEKKQVIDILSSYLPSNSSIVKTCVMQAFADLADSDKYFRVALYGRIEELAKGGTPAMQARGRRLLSRLQS